MFKIVSRVKKIVSANVNDAIDNLENPEKLLRQAVREMEASISQTQKSTSAVMADKTLLEKEMEKCQHQIKFWQEQAQTALAGNNEELARKAIASKQEQQGILKNLEEQCNSTAQTVEMLCKQLQGMQTKYDEAKRKLNSLIARKRAADIRQRASGLETKFEVNTDAFAQFDRMKEKVEEAEARADAMRAISQQQFNVGSVPAEPEGTKFEDLAIDKELAELKASMNN